MPVTGPPAAPARGRRGLDAAAASAPVMAAAYALLAVAATWPLSRALATTVPLGVADVWQNLWNFWWWREALVHRGATPYATDMLYHPVGAALAVHTHSTFNQIAFLPVSLLAGPAAALNVALMAGMALSGLSAYLLARALTGSAWGGVVAGVIYGFCPHQREESLDHLNLVSAQFPPLVCLFALRWLRRGAARDAALLGIAVGLTALACEHYAVMALLALAVLLPCQVLALAPPARPSAAAALRAAALAAASSLAVAGAALWPLLRAALYGDSLVKPFRSDRGIDIAFLFVPPDRHPVLGPMTAPLYDALRTYPSVGFYAYLGFLPLLLAAAAWPRLRRDAGMRAWAWLGLTFAVLACGAHPLIAGRWFDLPLPHAWFAAVPVLAALRHAHRFLVVVMLALAVLAAAGVARLTAAGRRRWLGPLAAAAICFEFAWSSYPVQPVPRPPYIDVLRARGGAVLDLPFGVGGTVALNQALQVAHERPIAGGYVSAPPAAAFRWLRSEPSLAGLYAMSAAAPVDVARLGALGFRSAVVHLDRSRESRAAAAAAHRDQPHFERRVDLDGPDLPRATLEAWSAQLAAAAGPPIYEDGATRVYALGGR